MIYFSHFKNFDLTSIVTPLNVQQYKHPMEESKYDLAEMNFCCVVSQNDSPLGMMKNKWIQRFTPNLRLDCSFSQVLCDKINKEFLRKEKP